MYGSPETGEEKIAFDRVVRTMAMELVRWSYIGLPAPVPTSWDELEERDQIIFTARAEHMFRLGGAAVAGIPL